MLNGLNTIILSLDSPPNVFHLPYIHKSLPQQTRYYPHMLAINHNRVFTLSKLIYSVWTLIKGAI